MANWTAKLCRTRVVFSRHPILTCIHVMKSRRSWRRFGKKFSTHVQLGFATNFSILADIHCWRSVWSRELKKHSRENFGLPRFFSLKPLRNWPRLSAKNQKRSQPHRNRQSLEFKIEESTCRCSSFTAQEEECFGVTPICPATWALRSRSMDFVRAASMGFQNFR